MDPRREHVRRLLQVEAYISEVRTEVRTEALTEGREPGADNQPAGKQTVAQIIDISRMGVAFVSDHAMKTDEPYVLNFCFPGSAIRNELKLSIVHSGEIGTHGRYRNGARFLAISEACADRIVDYVTTAPAD